MKKIFGLIFLLGLIQLTCAQQETSGKLHIIYPQAMNTLLENDSIYHSTQKLDGYRIQICMESGNDAVDRAKVVIDDFTESFPNIPVYLSFGQPYYRVRVGDFRNRLEAEGQLRFIMKEFNQAFVTKDQIELPALVSFPFNTQNNEQDNPFGD